MARIKIDLPEQSIFQTTIPVRITDLNYGGHVGNDKILSIVQEARVQFLAQFGYTELNVEGMGLIMSDACLEYKDEVFYGEDLFTKIYIADITRIGFDLLYKLEKSKDGEFRTVAIVKTGMLFYDYNNKKLASIPEAFKSRFQ